MCLLASVGVLTLVACYEIPPRVEDMHAEPAASSPAAVYGAHRFDPENLWFESAFRRGARARALPEDGREMPPPAGTDEPLPPGAGREVEQLTAVDRAEMLALLDRMVDREPGSESEPARARFARAVLHADLLALQCQLADAAARADDPRLWAELEEMSARAATVNEPERELGAGDWPHGLPPPLRRGAWRARARELPAGLLPSRRDLRWSRVFAREGDGAAVALVRLRVGRVRGEVALLDLPSECWVLEWQQDSSASPPKPSVWRVDRVLLARGEDPWRRVESATIAVRDPRGGGEWLTGTPTTLCARCHEGERTSGVALEPAGLDAQLNRARDALR